jgi:ParB family chromosome partitioning protein
MITEIDIDKIKAGKFCLRDLDDEIIGDMSSSIKEVGLLQPILVRPISDGYELVFGFHRLQACKQLGWKKIPVIIKDASSEEEAFIMHVIENIQRNNHINPIAEAQVYKLLIERGWTMVQIAEKIGKSCSYVSDRLRVLDKLHPSVQRKLSFPRGKTHLTLSHAEHLSLIDDPQEQLRIAKKIEDEGASVRKLERMVRKLRKIGENMPEGCLCKDCKSYPCNKIS